MVTNTTIYTRQIYCTLHDDSPPADIEFHNGDELVIIDQDTRMIFDEENQTWRQIPMSGGSGGGTLITKAITENGTYSAEDDNADGYSSVTVDVPVPSLQWTLIGTSQHTLTEWTDTSTEDTTDTSINISNTDYAYILITITCDTPITTSNEWGMTLAIGGRSISNQNYVTIGSGGQIGSATLSFAGMVGSTKTFSGYGMWVQNNTSTIKFSRKCHGTVCPKIRAGNYTVKVYGLSAM